MTEPLPLIQVDLNYIRENVSRIHRSGIEKKDIMTGKKEEFTVVRVDPIVTLQDADYVCSPPNQGMSCTNECFSGYSKRRSLVDASLLPGLIIDGESGFLTITSPFQAELTFTIESCYHFNLRQEKGIYSDIINPFFRICWDSKRETINNGTVCTNFHASISLRGNLLRKERNLANWGIGKDGDIKFTENCFPLNEWVECHTKFVKIPHNLAQWIRDMHYDTDKMKEKMKKDAKHPKFRGNEHNILSFLLEKFSAAGMKEPFEICDIVDKVIGACLCAMTGSPVNLPTPEEFQHILAELPGDNYGVSWRDILEELMLFSNHTSLMLLGDNLKNDHGLSSPMIFKEFPPSLSDVLNNLSNHRSYLQAAKNAIGTSMLTQKVARIHELLAPCLNTCFLSLFSSSVILTLENLPEEVSDNLAKILEDDRELCQLFLRAATEDLGEFDPDTEPVTVHWFKHQFITPEGLPSLNITLSSMVVTGYKVDEASLGEYSLKATCAAAAKSIALIRNNLYGVTDRVMVMCMDRKHRIKVSGLVKGGSPTSLRNQEHLVTELCEIPILKESLENEYFGPCNSGSFILLFSCSLEINEEIAQPELLRYLKRLQIKTEEIFRKVVRF